MGLGVYHGPGKRVHGSEDTLWHLAQTSTVNCSPHSSSIPIVGKDPPGGQKHTVFLSTNLQGFSVSPPKSFLESEVFSLPGIAPLRVLSQVPAEWGPLVPFSTP